MLIIEKMERLYFNIDKQKATKVTYMILYVLCRYDHVSDALVILHASMYRL